ncbi:endonuclease/exonuclease/phosphatase family protein [Sphingomonas gilva]|uniref:Endonuclease/exonuclease/phosphatase family protein n=1 Tax=Sphingomonas gilva TaxID=2305907 RepID=A0A396RPD2_9SPHN|nr:endonuclease/exonuclease/phosphatase family protein [Sphingomonas gilva]RHW18380.1 endonuclease/exonuclease/phosphatase family protein [Sphingomonas gilva]
MRGPMLDRRTLLLAAAALPLSACATGAASKRPAIRVATFNIWHNAGNWEARLPLLLQALREADADVIALQEVLEDAGKGLPNQADTIARALGGYSVHFFATEPPGSPKRYGNAILTRLPVIAEASRKLEPLNDYRTALRVRVSADGRPVDIVVTHLAWQPEAGAVRARQVADLMSWLPRDGVPLVVMGDFNAPLSDSGLAALTSPRFESALPPGATDTTLNPAKGHKPRVIDHIFAERRWFGASHARRIGDRPVAGEYPSDHFGVAATLQFN